MIIHLNDCWSGECPLIGPALYVWVQGCPRRCPGCCNLTAQDPDAPASKVRVEDLAAEALARPGGLVLSGGEPLLQAAELTTLCRLVREKRPDALILAYTGYTLEEVVQAARPEWFDLLKCLDVLVDGPYDQDRPSEDPLLGSSNQRVIVLGRSLPVRRVLETRQPGVQVALDREGALRLVGTGGRGWSMNELVDRFQDHGLEME